MANETFQFSREELELLLGEKRVDSLLERRRLNRLDKDCKLVDNDLDIAIRLMTGHSRPNLWSGRLAKAAVKFFLTHENFRVEFIQWMKSQREAATTDRVREVSGTATARIPANVR